MTDLGCLILASGKSLRFGSNKLLAQLSNGAIMIDQTVSIYKRCGLLPNVIVAADNLMLIEHLQYSASRMVLNANAWQGLSASIITGVNQLSPGVTGVIIALGDMPYVSGRTIQQLLALVKPEQPQIIQPCHREKLGNPVYFSRHYFNQLEQLGGDNGARWLIKENRQHHIMFECNDPGVLHDIDVPGDILAS